MSDINSNYCFDEGLSPGQIGTYTFSLRFRYKTLQFKYTVNDANITSGYVEKGSSDNPILLNGQASLIKQDIYLYNEDSGEYVFYTGLTENDIIEDIDTSIAGEQFAKINVNGHEVSIRYYVVDLDKVQFVNIPQIYYQNSSIPINGSFTAEFTMEDGEVFEQYFYRLIINIGQTTKVYIITGIDTSTIGTKYARVYYYGYDFDVEYTVK